MILLLIIITVWCGQFIHAGDLSIQTNTCSVSEQLYQHHCRLFDDIIREFTLLKNFRCTTTNHPNQVQRSWLLDRETQYAHDQEQAIRRAHAGFLQLSRESQESLARSLACFLPLYEDKNYTHLVAYFVNKRIISEDIETILFFLWFLTLKRLRNTRLDIYQKSLQCSRLFILQLAYAYHMSVRLSMPEPSALQSLAFFLHMKDYFMICKAKIDS